MFEKIRKKIKNYKVAQKLRYSFTIIICGFIFSLLVGAIGMIFINSRIRAFYSKAYTNTTLQMEIRKDIQMIGKQVLWAVTEEDDAGTQEKIEVAALYATYVTENIATLQANFDNDALIAELESAVATLRTSREEVLALASAHKNDEALALFNGDYTVATERVQDILIQIGDYADEQALSTYNISRISGFICQFIMGITCIVCIVTCMRLSRLITASICEPIEELAIAANQLRNGDLDTHITYESEDELGSLANDFRAASVSYTHLTLPTMAVV